ncbi:MAG: hypothetical protein A2V66_15655 [Ignavibacteria bacterium RBG_13_36_8]|nr:MAG: hypothetical protein A2V66_15655 [Ignavibacteria bacterium RBG_13_36_8]
MILRNVIVLTLLSAVYSLLMVQKYTSTATILPPSSEMETMFGFISGGIPGGLSGISKLAGGLPGLTSPSDLYAAVLNSGYIRSIIVNKYDLKKEFKAKTMEDANKMLSKIVNISVTPEGIIVVSVIYKNKFLAADIANSFVEELDKFNNEVSMTMGKKYRIFIEERLKETTDSLYKSEEALRKFQEENRTIAIDEELKSIIETIAHLKSELILREVQLGAIRSSSIETNPLAQGLGREIYELKKQLTKMQFGNETKDSLQFGAGFSIPLMELPELSLLYVRLVRDVKVQEAIYELLIQQYEQAKIMELKDTPTIQILDKAGPPEKRSAPKRKIIVIFAVLLSLFASIPLVFFMEYINEIRNEPEAHANIIKIITIIQKDILRAKTALLKKPRK